MILKSALEVTAACCMSILIGTLFIFYQIATSIFRFAFTFGFRSMSSCIWTLAAISVFTFYGWSSWVFYGILLQTTKAIGSFFSIAIQNIGSTLRIEKASGFESLMESIWVLAIYFFTVAFFFTVTYSIAGLIGNSIIDLKLLIRSCWQRLKRLPFTSGCSICLGESANLVLECGHSFHFLCITKWKAEKNSCPYCRAPITD